MEAGRLYGTLYGSGTFFIPSRASGIPVCATGIPPQTGRFLPCEHFLPGRDGGRDDLGVVSLITYVQTPVKETQMLL
jgi:hypothetical protein